MLSSGFFNSKGGDRKYDAEQFGAMFNGLITDGVFAHYKDALKVTAGSGNRELVIKPGRAWFNGTWTEVDDGGHSVYLMGSAVESTYFVYLAVDKRDRKNSIAWYSNIKNDDPDLGLYFYLLAQVTIPGGATKITDSMITDTRGSDMCPYVTGILETVSFEDLVKQVCGDNWKEWLGVYESSVTTGVQNAVAVSNRALSEVESLKSYNIETEATSYIWAKYEAIRTGGGGFTWATDSVHTELTDPPMPMYLFRDLSVADLGDGSLPRINLGRPYAETPKAEPKAIPASTQANVWMEYPYFWEGGNLVGTEVLRYDSLRRVIVNSGGNAVEKYTYRVSRLIISPNVYKPGEYVGTVTADNATAYPRDGYKDGHWYKRFASKADDVYFDSPDFSSKNVRDALNELMQGCGTTSQFPEGTRVYVCTDGEYAEGGVPDVENPGSYAYYWVPKNADGTIYASWAYENGGWKFVEDLTVTLVETDDETCENGLSAYEIAVKNGFNGSEQEWLESLKGKDGQNGGPGKDGADGKTPVKGVDYFTTNDVQEIAEQAAGKVPLVTVAKAPVFVDNKSKMIDTDEVYVLVPDGSLWAYMEVDSVELGAELFEIGGIKADDGMNGTGPNRIRTEQIPCHTEATISIVCNSNAKWIVHFFRDGVWLGKTSFKSTSCDDILQLYSQPDDVTHVRLLLAYTSDANVIDIPDLLSNVTIAQQASIMTWCNTGMAYNQPVDYEDRILAMERELEVLANGTF